MACLLEIYQTVFISRDVVMYKYNLRLQNHAKYVCEGTWTLASVIFFICLYHRHVSLMYMALDAL